MLQTDRTYLAFFINEDIFRSYANKHMNRHVNISETNVQFRTMRQYARIIENTNVDFANVLLCRLLCQLFRRGRRRPRKLGNLLARRLVVRRSPR